MSQRNAHLRRHFLQFLNAMNEAETPELCDFQGTLLGGILPEWEQHVRENPDDEHLDNQELFLKATINVIDGLIGPLPANKEELAQMIVDWREEVGITE